MLRELIDRLAGVPKETALRWDELRPGRIAVEGRLYAEEPIAAPIGGADCAGYSYKCTHQVNSRLKGYIRRKLREVLVYAPSLRLEVEGGSVALEPQQHDLWSAAHHNALLQEDYMGFQATERLLVQGARVRIIGRLSKAPGGGLSLRFAELHLLEAAKDGGAKAAPTRKGFRKAPKGKAPRGPRR